MLDENSIIKLSQNILKRYEHNIDDGVLFLYDVKTDDIWIGNSSSNDLVRLIDGSTSLRDIYLKLMPLFEGYKYSEIQESFNVIITELIDKKFIEIISAELV